MDPAPHRGQPLQQVAVHQAGNGAEHVVPQVADDVQQEEAEELEAIPAAADGVFPADPVQPQVADDVEAVQKLRKKNPGQKICLANFRQVTDDGEKARHGDCGYALSVARCAPFRT